MEKRKLFKDIICIFLAIILALIIVKNTIQVPSYELISFCEESLNDYLKNPVNYKPEGNLVIYVSSDGISASVPNTFMITKATCLENGEYTINTTVQTFTILFGRIIMFITFSCGLYVLLRILYESLLWVLFKVFQFIKKIFILLLQKIQKFFSNLDSKRKQKTANKDFEDPKLKEAYELGYRIGMADGISKGKEIASNKLNTYFQNP